MIMDRQGLKAFKADASYALAKVAKSHGVTLTMGAARFSTMNATLKFDIALIGPCGEVHSVEAENFKSRAFQFGLKALDLGGLFTVGTTVYKITGLKPRRPKYPICATRVSDGKAFKFPASAVRNIAPQ